MILSACGKKVNAAYLHLPCLRGSAAGCCLHGPNTLPQPGGSSQPLQPPRTASTRRMQPQPLQQEVIQANKFCIIWSYTEVFFLWLSQPSTFLLPSPFYPGCATTAHGGWGLGPHTFTTWSSNTIGTRRLLHALRCCELPRHRHTHTLQKAIETRLHLSLSFWSAMASSRATDFGFFSLFPFKFSQSAWLNLQTSESLVAVWPSLSFISNSEKRIIAR